MLGLHFGMLPIFVPGTVESILNLSLRPLVSLYVVRYRLPAGKGSPTADGPTDRGNSIRKIVDGQSVFASTTCLVLQH